MTRLSRFSRPAGWARVATGSLPAARWELGARLHLLLWKAYVRLGMSLLTAASGHRRSLDEKVHLAKLASQRREVLAVLAALPYGATVYELPALPDPLSLWVPAFTGLPVPVGGSYPGGRGGRAGREIDLRLGHMGELAHGRDPTLLRTLARRYRIAGAVSWGGEEPALGTDAGVAGAHAPGHGGVASARAGAGAGWGSAPMGDGAGRRRRVRGATTPPRRGSARRHS
jgi:hypothetical protein